MSASPAPCGLVGWGGGGGRGAGRDLHIVSASARPELSGWKRNFKRFNLSHFVDVDLFFFVCVDIFPNGGFFLRGNEIIYEQADCEKTCGDQRASPL